MQAQSGVWLMTLQTALWPQAPGQGSRHFWLMHASWLGHSELIVHSGRQLGAWPRKVARQEQAGTPLMLRHSEFGPQGVGTQGSRRGSSLVSMGGAKAREELLLSVVQEVGNPSLRGMVKQRVKASPV